MSNFSTPNRENVHIYIVLWSTVKQPLLLSSSHEIKNDVLTKKKIERERVTNKLVKAKLIYEQDLLHMNELVGFKKSFKSFK